MTPLQCVLEDIHKRIAKLRLEARPALGLPADIKTLTQVLSGSVNVQVNGGTAEVCQVFLHPDNVSKWDPTDIAELKLALGQFVHASGEALQVAVKLAAAVSAHTNAHACPSHSFPFPPAASSFHCFRFVSTGVVALLFWLRSLHGVHSTLTPAQAERPVKQPTFLEERNSCPWPGGMRPDQSTGTIATMVVLLFSVDGDSVPQPVRSVAFFFDVCFFVCFVRLLLLPASDVRCLFSSRLLLLFVAVCVRSERWQQRLHRGAAGGIRGAGQGGAGGRARSRSGRHRVNTRGDTHSHPSGRASLNPVRPPQPLLCFCSFFDFSVLTLSRLAAFASAVPRVLPLSFPPSLYFLVSVATQIQTKFFSFESSPVHEFDDMHQPSNCMRRRGSQGKILRSCSRARASTTYAPTRQNPRPDRGSELRSRSSSQHELELV